MFDTSDREVKMLLPLVDSINELETQMQGLTDSQLAAKTEEFKERFGNGESLDDLLPEAFAVVREMSKRTLGMRQFDVQLLGGAVLHQGRIAEMKTGEGKTLVAVAPMYLNALTGKGAHLVTVNDYLARRDAAWMGPIYHKLGLSIGIIQGRSPDSDELGGSYRYDPEYTHDDPRYNFLRPCSRREAYLADIVYGTNHEFGFDYLRDNMAFSVEQLSMRALNFALVDEVDSILIDEARTPHIISGPSQKDISIYKVVDKIVRTMEAELHYTADRKSHSASLTEEGMDYFEEQYGIDNIAEDPLLIHHLNASVKAYALFDKDVHYVIRGQEVVIVDENTGRLMFGRRFGDGLHQALEAKEGVPVQRESQTVATITFQNLFRMYDKLAGMTGTAKTEEDEFRKIYGLDVVSVPTHRDMKRIDQPDVVYKSLDAKFRGIAREILRLYSKQQPVLVGTRSIEMSESVSHRLTGEMLQKLVLADRILGMVEDKKGSKDFRTEAEKVASESLDDLELRRLGEIARMGDMQGKATDPEALSWFIEKHKLSLDVEDYLKEALLHGVPHNILNAKYHEREALIISEAGRKGAVTIATNMAGRGVDILLGGRVTDENLERDRAGADTDGGVTNEFADMFQSFRRGGQERAAPPLPLNDQERSKLAEEVRELGGLYILGTERHESRRIDNQLRGRAGRQGDPGESRFFVSLEDQLWKVFNAKMMENPMLKAWPNQEVIDSKMITNMIRKTQERIENHFFEARKHVLEYDDVLNAQREHVYAMRREILLGKDCGEEIRKGISETIAEAVEKGYDIEEETMTQVLNHGKVYDRVSQLFPVFDHMTLDEMKAIEDPNELVQKLTDVASKAYSKVTEEVGPEEMPKLEQHVMLRSVNDKWMDHLQMIDYIREGINLRAYGQTDPLAAYKRETYELFQATQKGIRDMAVQMIFKAQIIKQQRPAPQMMRVSEDQADQVAQGQNPTQPAAPKRPMGFSAPGASAVMPAPTAASPDPSLANVDWSKVKRNDPCPCGSGKKFKNCHYPILRQQGTI